VRPQAKRIVIRAIVLAAIPWMVFFSMFLGRILGTLPGVAIAIVAGLAVALFFPDRVVAGRVYQSLVESKGSTENQRLRNIADGLAIAIGVPAEKVQVIDSKVPNVLALPTKSHGLVVVATASAVQLMSRTELEALVASQVVVAGDPWVRRATRAQLAQAPWALLLGSVMVFGIPLFPPAGVVAFGAVFVYTFGKLGRTADAARDLVADSVAINTTKNPDALVGAFRRLRPAAFVASEQKLGSIGAFVDPFAVLSARSKATNTVSVNGKSRTWSTEDEVATELGFRAERMEHVSMGNFTSLESLAAFRKAWGALGTDNNPYRLLDEERSVAAAAVAAANEFGAA
jgi:Zn-dependent protease with chaperone function